MLHMQDRELIACASHVFRRCIGSIGLLLHVINAQGKDRKPVDGAAGRFGVEPRARHGNNAALRKLLHKEIVDPFDGVVALLVIAIDGALHRRDCRVAGIGAAGFVFLVPQQEIELVLLAHNIQQLAIRIGNLLRVPPLDHRLLQRGDLRDEIRIVEHGQRGARG